MLARNEVRSTCRQDTKQRLVTFNNFNAMRTAPDHQPSETGCLSTPQWSGRGPPCTEEPSPRQSDQNFVGKKHWKNHLAAEAMM